MDNQRLILLMVFCFSVIMLWDGWEKHNRPPVNTVSAQAPANASAVPTPTASAGNAMPPAVVPGSAVATVAPREVVVTDLFRAEISAQGGDLVRLELNRHKATNQSDKHFVLFDSGEQHIYLAQSGLIGEGLPNHKTLWQVVPGDHTLKEGQDTLVVQLQATTTNGVWVTKTYTFHRGSYLVDVAHDIVNGSGAEIAPSAYYQITRDGKAPESHSSGMMGMGASTFTGPAVYTDEQKFQKVPFQDITDGTHKHATKASNGWVAMVQHYFVSAWLPAGNVEREFFTRKVGDDLYSAGVIVSVGGIAPGTGKRVDTRLYAGPQEQDKLKQIAPGLNLVVDYGWLTLIAAPIFWVLEAIHKVVSNWGWSIIVLTIMIKLVFFPLSAASYRSMAKMRLVTPKLQKLKETYGDDKMRLNQEMMELYKKEKINPLGGCLPILIQIPVFIALYWVLLGAVEMRNAPWVGWITDLSVKDPYYVLPLIMGVTMIIQTKLNPTPPDPMQAKIMMIMPVVFTGMFLFFPAGLVLYWTVNNLLSIAQQWQITRMIEGGGKKAA
jgi:YidC/Oxa1 family membrane protein insertase